jgi:hypothetical protein
MKKLCQIKHYFEVIHLQSLKVTKELKDLLEEVQKVAIPNANNNNDKEAKKLNFFRSLLMSSTNNTASL